MNRHTALIITVSLLIGACTTVGPDYTGPPQAPVRPAEPYHSTTLEQVKTESLYRSEEPVDLWWRQLQDESLNRLIDKALNANTDLRVALANVTAARAVLVESETRLQPTINVDGSVQASRQSSVFTGSSDRKLDDNIVTSATIGLAWEIDVFGRVRRSIEVANANIERSEALHDDVRRIVIADVASALMDLRGAQERRVVIERNINNQRETLDLTMTMAREGMVSEVDTARARAQLTATEALLPTVISDEIVAFNRLARLTGTTPGQLGADLLQSEPLPAIPAFIPVGDAASLIRRRPDIREAERALAGLTAQIGVATADLFPTVSFGASIGLSADRPGNLANRGAPNYAVGPGITWNLFNREAIRARLRQAEANVDAQLARYDGVVLKALEEVNSALIRHARERDRNAALLESVKASREAVELVRIRYNAGAESFLGVLDAERTLLEAEQQLTTSNVQLAQGLIVVYRTLGGGWQN